MNQVWQKREFKIYHADDGYILHNSRLEGFKHSHIKSFETAKYIAELSLHKRVPHDLCKYLLVSLIRINDDEIYCRKIQELIDAKDNKGNNFYRNPQKGKRK